MTTVTFTIPHTQIPAVASALVAIYGDAARDLGLTVTGSEPRLAAVEALRSENLLAEIQTQLVLLSWGAPADLEAVRLEIAPVLLVHALRTAVCDATDTLAGACDEFLSGGTEDPLSVANDALTVLLALLAEARALAADQVPVTVPVYGRTARLLHGEALATGRRPSEIVGAAVRRWIGRGTEAPGDATPAR